MSRSAEQDSPIGGYAADSSPMGSSLKNSSLKSNSLMGSTGAAFGQDEGMLSTENTQFPEFPDAFAENGFMQAAGGPSPDVEVYLTGVYRREQDIARMLLDLDAQIKRTSGDADKRRKLEEKISRLEEQEEIVLDPLQRQAVLESAGNAILLITGGPGTGKTTTINTIIRFFIGEDMRVLLAAPTGRAARRMSEATGYPAMTIHRLLGVRSVSGDNDDT